MAATREQQHLADRIVLDNTVSQRRDGVMSVVLHALCAV